MGPAAASTIRARSSASTPVICTGRTRGPYRQPRSSSACALRPVATTLRAHGQSHGDAGPAETAGGAAHQQGLAGLQIAGQQAAERHQKPAQRGPLASVRRVDVPDRRHVLGRQQQLLGERAVVVELVQGPAGRAAVGPTQEDGVRVQRVVARADGRVAIDPLADLQLGSVRACRPHAADASRAGRHRRIQQIVARAVEDAGGVAGDPRGHHINDHLPRAQHRVRQGLDGERFAEGGEDSGFHGPLSSAGPGRPRSRPVPSRGP